MAFKIKNGVLKKYTEKPGVTEAVIPDSVTEIGGGAFYYCTSLTSIMIPDSVTKIGNEAFDYCRSLASVTIPDSVTEIGYEPFFGCTSLKQLTIFGCTVDKTLWDFNRVTLGEVAYMLRNKAYNVTMEHSVKYMFVTQVLINTDQPEAEAYVKKNFTKFAQFSIDRSRIDELKRYESIGFFTKANTAKHILYALGQEKKNNEVILYLLSVKDKLGGFKLDEIDKLIELALENVELTAALLEYKNKYFTTEQIEEIESDRIDKELGFKERTAAEWKKIFSYEVKDGEVTITAYKGSDLDVIIPETICKKPVTAIADMVFSPEKPKILKAVKENLGKIKSVYIGDNVKRLGRFLFKNCSSLTSVTIPDGVTAIGDSYFEGCKSLKSVTLPNGLTRIGWKAFMNCNSLTSLTIPDSVTIIGDSNFRGCTSLTSVTMSDNATTICEEAFYNCTSLTSITIPDSVTTIGERAFYYCE